MEIRDERRNPLFIHSEIDDMGLTVYEFRIYARLVRRSGQKGAYESVKKMAEGCLMGEHTVRKAIQGLTERGMVRRQERAGYTAVYWLTDVSRWKTTPYGSVTTPLTDQSGVPLTDQEDEGTPREGTPIRTLSKSAGNFPSVDPTLSHPAVLAYQQTFTDWRLAAHQREKLVAFAGKDAARLDACRKTFEEWRTNDWSPKNLTGMLEMAERTVSTSQRDDEATNGLATSRTTYHASGARRGPGGGRPTAAERSGGLTAAEVIDGANSALAILRANAGGSV
jgi:predicted DNA-binding transcriptional regulator